MPDKLDDQIREELEKYNFPTDDQMVARIRKQYEAKLLVQRIFEPIPANWESAFSVGDSVELVRPFFGLPVGAIGKIESIETAYHEDGTSKEEWELSSDFFKGRPYCVRFDLEPFSIPFEPKVYEAIREHCEKEGIEEIPTHYVSMSTNAGPHDIRKINNQDGEKRS